MLLEKQMGSLWTHYGKCIVMEKGTTEEVEIDADPETGQINKARPDKEIFCGYRQRYSNMTKQTCCHGDC